jgi:glutamate-1-semialdehyde 2,1-aminomutase
MAMLPPTEYDRLAQLGQRVREGLADLLETRGINWQVSGQASLFKLHPHPRPVTDYRSSVATAEERAAMERFYLEMFGEGIILTPDLAGCMSTPMTDAEADALVAAADRSFDSMKLS